jgi:hypothetical protein
MFPAGGGGDRYSLEDYGLPPQPQQQQQPVFDPASQTWQWEHFDLFQQGRARAAQSPGSTHNGIVLT